MDRKLRIVQIHSGDLGGGAEVMARMLHEGFLRHGHDAWFLVGRRQLDGDKERTVPTPRHGLFRGELKFRKWIEDWRGLQYFASPTLSGKNWPFPFRPDVILVHSIHGASSYFRTEDLKWLSEFAPTFIYLQDQFLMTGHCAYSLGCERWQQGCGQCPDLTIYPSVTKDRTSANFLRKQRILSSASVQVGSPARWILELAHQSPILSHLPQFHIPNAYDPVFFNPAGRVEARRNLGISLDKKVVLFLAQAGTKSSFKDFETLVIAFRQLNQNDFPVTLITVGDRPTEETRMALPGNVHFFPYSADRHKIADYYRAADVFCHSTKADVLPLAILESLACGTPVIGTEIGGVPEIVIPGNTGWTFPIGRADCLADILSVVLRQPNVLKEYQQRAIEFSKDFTIDVQVDRFIKLFRCHMHQA